MKRDEFDGHLSHIMKLIAKMLKTYPGGSQLSEWFQKHLSDKVNLNLCFFNFVPMSPEDMEHVEELLQSSLNGEAVGEGEENEDEFSWNSNDVDFLKRHGISF